MKRIVIVGAGFRGSELYSYLIDLSAHGTSIEFAGFADNKGLQWIIKQREDLGERARVDDCGTAIVDLDRVIGSYT